MKLSSITRKRKRSCFVIQSGSTHTFGTIQIIAKYRSHKSIKNSYVNRGLWRFKE